MILAEYIKEHEHDSCLIHEGAMVAWSSYLKSKETGSVMWICAIFPENDDHG